MTTCKHPSELIWVVLLLMKYFSSLSVVINPYILAFISWISNYLIDVPPAGTDGMKIRFPTTSSRSTTASHLYDNDNRTGVDVRIEPMYISPHRAAHRSDPSSTAKSRSCRSPRYRRRFAYLNACIIETLIRRPT